MLLKIVKPGAKIVTPLEQINDYPRQLEIAGRTCYKSEEKMSTESAERFIRMIVNSGHHSVLEHCTISVRIIGDRSMSHQLVRHRIGSYSQESQRYCDYGEKGFQVIIPPSIGELMPGSYVKEKDDWFFIDTDRKSKIDLREVGELALEWLNSVSNSYEVYLNMRNKGIPPEDARSVLPNATKTEVFTTYNLRQWRHVFMERALNPRAQWQIREIMNEILVQFKKHLRVVFEDLE